MTWGVATLVSVSVLLTSGVTALAQPQRAGAEDELIRLDKQLAAAEAKGDGAAVEQILAPDYVLIDQTGRTGDRAHALGVMKKMRSTSHQGSIETDDYKVRVYGDTAVMTHRARIKGAEGGVEQLRATHVWLRRNGRWQIISDQCTSISHPQLPAAPYLDAACSDASFSPEVVQYYGDSAAVLGRLEKADLHVSERRAYLMLIETADSAQLMLFERTTPAEPLVRVSQWKGASLGDLREQLTSLILDNRGIACIGQQSASVIKAMYRPGDLGSIPAPRSASAAFAHPVKAFGADYMRVSLFLLC